MTNSEMGADFLLVSVVAGVLGFTGISARQRCRAVSVLCVVVIFLALLILGLTIFGSNLPSWPAKARSASSR